MSGTKENCSLETLQKIVKQKWPTYAVFGNQPYHPETIIVKREGDQYTIVQRFDKNYSALQAMITPGWSPEHPLAKDKSLFGALPQHTSTKPLAKKLVELLLSAQVLGDLFGVNVDEPLKLAREIYTKQK
jgi:hypothetical protein